MKRRTFIKNTTLAAAASVADHRDPPAHADQELVAFPVRVFAAHLHQRHLVDQEIALGVEGNVVTELADGQVAPCIGDVRQFDQSIAHAITPHRKIRSRNPPGSAARRRTETPSIKAGHPPHPAAART